MENIFEEGVQAYKNCGCGIYIPSPYLGNTKEYAIWESGLLFEQKQENRKGIVRCFLYGPK